MQCREVVELLSAYHDGELSPDKADAVAEHLAVCSDCSTELDALQKMSDLAKQLYSPSPPRHVWPRIAAQLDAKHSPTTPAVLPSRRASRKSLLAVAALLLAGMSWVAFMQWQHHAERNLAVNFGEFLDNFEQAPDEAEVPRLVAHFGQQRGL